MEASVVLVALLMIIPVALVALFKYRRDWEQTRQRYGPQTEPDDSIYYEGVGAETTRPFRLRAGRYKLAYAFPESALVKVDLLHTASGERETLALKSGTGASEFEVAESGRCRLVIEPADADAEWEVEITPLMLPSRRPPER